MSFCVESIFVLYKMFHFYKYEFIWLIKASFSLFHSLKVYLSSRQYCIDSFIKYSILAPIKKKRWINISFINLSIMNKEFGHYKKPFLTIWIVLLGSVCQTFGLLAFWTFWKERLRSIITYSKVLPCLYNSSKDADSV